MAQKTKEVYVEPQVTQEDIEKQKRQQEKEYLGPREMACQYHATFFERKVA